MPRRVFKGDPDRVDDLYRVASTDEVQDDELTVFIQEMEGKLSKASFGLFNRMAHLPPVRRLSVNLKSLLDCMANKEFKDILRDGLTNEERQALIELQGANATPRMKEIGHALLCVDERFELAEVLSQEFRRLFTKRGGSL